MKTSIRKIGNSKGIILSQAFLKECSIEDEVNVEVKNNLIIISPANDVKRAGWAGAFKEMAEAGDDKLMLPDVFNDEDLGDWKW